LQSFELAHAFLVIGRQFRANKSENVFFFFFQFDKDFLRQAPETMERRKIFI
jgi:hypothetical protein